MFKRLFQSIQLLFTPSIALYLIPSLLVALGYAFTLMVVDWLFVWWKANLDTFAQWSMISDLTDEQSLAKYSDITFKFIRYFVLIESYKFIILTIFAPLYDMISQKVEHIMVESVSSKPKKSWVEKLQAFDWLEGIKKWGRQIIRGLCMQVSGMMYDGILFLFAWIVAQLYPTMWYADFLFIIISSFSLGFGLYDYILERKGYGFKKSWSFGHRNYHHVVLCGLLGVGLMNLGYVGVVFAAPLGVIFATLTYIELTQNRLC